MAEAARLTVVMDHCMGATHALLGLGPGPDRHEDFATPASEETIQRVT